MIKDVSNEVKTKATFKKICISRESLANLIKVLVTAPGLMDISSTHERPFPEFTVL